MLNTYSKMLDKLQAVIRVCTIVLFIIMFSAIFLQICARAFFSKGFVWAEEAAKFSMIWLTMLTLGLATRWNQHYKADFLYDIMPPLLSRICKIFIFLLQFFFIGVLLIEGVQYIGTAMGGLAAGMQIPMSWIYISIPVGAAIMFLYTVEHFFGVVLKGNAGEEEKQWES